LFDRFFLLMLIWSNFLSFFFLFVFFPYFFDIGRVGFGSVIYPNTLRSKD
jgi:hypothetical protein